MILHKIFKYKINVCKIEFGGIILIRTFRCLQRQES